MSSIVVGKRRGSTEEMEVLASGESSSHRRAKVIDAGQEMSDVVRLSVDADYRTSSFKPMEPPPSESSVRKRFADGTRSPMATKNPTIRQRRFSIAARETVTGQLAKQNEVFAAAFYFGESSPNLGVDSEKTTSQKSLRVGTPVFAGPGTRFVLFVMIANGLAFYGCQMFAQKRVWPDDPKEEEVTHLHPLVCSLQHSVARTRNPSACLPLPQDPDLARRFRSFNHANVPPLREWFNGEGDHDTPFRGFEALGRAAYATPSPRVNCTHAFREGLEARLEGVTGGKTDPGRIKIVLDLLELTNISLVRAAMSDYLDA